jgi:hypothetical protein
MVPVNHSSKGRWAQWLGMVDRELVEKPPVEEEQLVRELVVAAKNVKKFK